MSSLMVRGYSVFMVFFLVACANTGHKALPSSAGETLLPIHVVAHLDKDAQVYLKSPSDRLGNSILQGYQALLNSSPGYVPALRSLYSFYYLNTQILDNTLLSYAQSRAGLVRLYPLLPPLIRREYFPPTFSAYQRNRVIKGLNSGAVNDRLLLNNLLVSVQESPHNATVRAVLAEHLIAMGYGVLAEAALREAASNDALEELYPHTLANYFYYQALDQNCIQDEIETIRPALSLYRTALKINPDADVHYQVGVIYGVLGLTPLMLNEAAVLATKADLPSLWRAAYLYIYAGDLTKAQRLFEQAQQIADLKTLPQSRAYIDYLMMTGQWQLAVEYYPYYLKAKHALGSYDVLLAGLMAAVAHSEDERISFDDAWPESSQLTHRHPGPALLFELMVGEKSYHDVLASVEGDRCQHAQLSFYAGFNAWVNDDATKLQEHLSNIKTLNLPFSLESLLAATLLQ